ncbi:MAG: TatD family hydrolase [Treponema sp.]|jgi:TatD DNase family protein|nr:TatD family hydrolase [Treponema sp.]
MKQRDIKLIDIGINLMHTSFNGDREQVLQAAEEAGVSPLIITGTSVRSSHEAMRYASKHPGKLYTTAGVHPHDAKNCTPKTLDELRRMAAGVLAIGECGLDYNRDFSPRNIQREWFEKQIQLAGELRLPLFLHERDAFGDFSGILEQNQAAILRMVVHCFTGTGRELDKYLELGCYIGITGWICDERRGVHLRDLLKNIPADKLLIETDAPFLMPRDMAGTPRTGRNEPKYLPHIAACIARHLDKPLETLAQETYTNTCRFFGIC